MENNYQNKLLQFRLEVQERSFRYFSDEIHDNVGQLLSAVKMELYNIRNSGVQPQVATKAADCSALLGKAINDLRNISHALNNGLAGGAGLEEAMEKDLAYIRAAKKIRCTVYKQGGECELDGEKELLVFRIFQEAVSNAVRHSATVIDVHLHYTPAEFSLRIEDNGKDFCQPVKGQHTGLSNMLTRTGILNGTLEIASVKHKGTTINLEIKRDQ